MKGQEKKERDERNFACPNFFVRFSNVLDKSSNNTKTASCRAKERNGACCFLG
jgi:hypothetical protein